MLLELRSRWVRERRETLFHLPTLKVSKREVVCGFHPEGASTTVLWASWAGSFLVGAVLCIVECLFNAGLYPRDAGSNTHTQTHTHTSPVLQILANISLGAQCPRWGSHKSRAQARHTHVKEGIEDSGLLDFSFYHFTYSTSPACFCMYKGSRQPLYRKRSNYFQHVSPKCKEQRQLQRRPSVIDVITYDWFT